MSKNDLKARPIFHHKHEAIDAHLTIVFATLAMGRMIEDRTRLSTKRFVKKLKPIRSGSVIINGKTYPAKPVVSEEVKEILRELDAGY